MSSPWDALARSAARGSAADELDSMLTGTSSLSRAFLRVDGEPGGLGSLAGVPSTPVPAARPSPPTGGSLVSVVFVSRGAGLDVCGGKIGEDGAKFCTLPCIAGGSTCGRVAKHEKAKANLAVPAYYINTPTKKGNGAFCHPVLSPPPTGFSPLAISVVGDGSTLRTVGEWREVFTVLSGFESFSPSEQQRVLDRLQSKINMGPTPMKPRTLQNLDDSEEEMMEASDSWLINVPHRYSGLMLEETEDDEGIVAQVRQHWNDVVHALVVQRRNFESMETTTNGVMESIDNKVVKVISMIGSPSDLAPAPDIWSSIGANTVHIKHLAVMQDTLKGSVDGLEGQVNVRVKASIQETNQKVNVLTEQISTVNVGMQGLSLELNQKVFPVVQDMYQRVTVIEGRGVGTTTDNQSVNDERVNALARMVELLGTEVSRLKSQTGGASAVFGTFHGASNNTSLEGQVGTLLSEVGMLKDEVKLLKEENVKLKRDMSTDSISFGGHCFPNKDSYFKFICDHSKKGYYGTCYDFISFMECEIDQNRTSDEAIKSLKVLGGVGYDGLSSGRIDTSFKTLIPKIFGKEQDPKDPSKKMEKLTSMDIWDHPTSDAGVKVDIQNFMTTYAETARGQIESTYAIHSPAYQFFNVMIDHIVSFWNRLETWITRFERELSAQCGGDDPTIHKAYIWKLICWMLHCMFKEFQKRRQPGTRNAMSTQELTQEEKRIKAASILEGTIHAHVFMEELVKDGFVRHPIFASTMVEFLLKTKASHVSLLELTKKQKALEVKVTGIQSNVDKIAAKKAGSNGNHGGGGGGAAR